MLIAILTIIVVLLAVCVIRTLAIKAPTPGVCDTQYTQEELDLCAQKLGDMVRVPTVSKREDEDLSDFYRFHEELERLFPLIHKHLEKTVLDGTLLYRWVGSDPVKKPLLLMGHQDVVPASDDGWTVPAYSGQVVDGNLYGRGSLDCESTMFVELQAIVFRPMSSG